jgi:hypothetical protein
LCIENTHKVLENSINDVLNSEIIMSETSQEFFKAVTVCVGTCTQAAKLAAAACMWQLRICASKLHDMGVTRELRFLQRFTVLYKSSLGKRKRTKIDFETQAKDLGFVHDRLLNTKHNRLLLCRMKLVKFLASLDGFEDASTYYAATIMTTDRISWLEEDIYVFDSIECEAGQWV